MTKQDLIDLAVEYGMIKSSQDFNERNAKQQNAIIKTIVRIADQMEVDGAF